MNTTVAERKLTCWLCQWRGQTERDASLLLRADAKAAGATKSASCHPAQIKAPVSTTPSPSAYASAVCLHWGGEHSSERQQEGHRGSEEQSIGWSVGSTEGQRCSNLLRRRAKRCGGRSNQGLASYLIRGRVSQSTLLGVCGLRGATAESWAAAGIEALQTQRRLKMHASAVQWRTVLREGVRRNAGGSPGEG